MIETIHFVRVGKKLSQHISPRPGGILFISGSHERWTHGAAGQLRLPAIAGSIALLRMLENILVLKTEDRFKSRSLLARRIAQHRIHRRRVYNFIRVENSPGVPGMLYFPQQLVIFV